MHQNLDEPQGHALSLADRVGEVSNSEAAGSDHEFDAFDDLETADELFAHSPRVA